MKYVVIVRYMFNNERVWKTIQREFNDMESAEIYAQQMYGSSADEITVLIYELKNSYN